MLFSVSYALFPPFSTPCKMSEHTREDKLANSGREAGQKRIEGLCDISMLAKSSHRRRCAHLVSCSSPCAVVLDLQPKLT
jgi:hypothetical protein